MTVRWWPLRFLRIRALCTQRGPQALSLFVCTYNWNLIEFDDRLKSIPFSILSKYRWKWTEMTSTNTCGGDSLKTLFRSEFSCNSESGVKLFAPQSFVGLPTPVCPVWIDTNTSANLLYALKYVSLVRCNTCVTQLMKLLIAVTNNSAISSAISNRTHTVTHTTPPVKFLKISILAKRDSLMLIFWRISTRDVMSSVVLYCTN